MLREAVAFLYVAMGVALVIAAMMQTNLPKWGFIGIGAIGVMLASMNFRPLYKGLKGTGTPSASARPPAQAMIRRQ